MEAPITLRHYQQKAVQDLWEWFNHNKQGDPCLVLPTGAGKSIIIAEICKQAMEYPNVRILKVTHTKEIIKQNTEKLRAVWPDAPLGVYSAGLNNKDINQITYAGLQSIRKHVKEVGKIDLMLVDEADRIPHKDEGTYRKLINDLREINPEMRVIGLTATPWRLGHGLITDAPAIFKELIEPITIEELQHQGYLANLTSKATAKKLNTDGVHKRGGEYIESELQAVINTSDNNINVVREIIEKSGDRQHWCIFCTGVQHADNIADILNSYGVPTVAVYGSLNNKERDRRINDFKSGRYKAITNINILSIGFDFPDIDLIAMLRPTMSPSLYCQQAGRGLRVKSDGGDCLVLDFAGVVAKHGPITHVSIPSKKGEGGGIAPSKVCQECDEIVHASVKTCPICGFVFPPPKKEDMYLREDDIMGNSVKTFDVSSWEWEIRTSKKGVDMVVVVYFGDMTEKPIYEYLTIWHEGYAGMKGMEKLNTILSRLEISAFDYNDVSKLIIDCEMKDPPTALTLKQRGKFYDIIDREWGIREPAGMTIETNNKSLFLEEDKIWF